MKSRTVTALTTILCSSVLLSGCAAPAESPAAAEAESPLSTFFASAYGGDLSLEDQEKKFGEEERQREELVAECMTDEGFEYTPNLQNASVSMSSADGEWDPESREWVSQYGYGMINYPGRDDMPSDGEDEYVDANADYVASLSESERIAFDEALHGIAPDPEDMPADGESMEWDWTTAGCYGWAQNEQGGEDPTSSEEHKPLMNAMNTFYETMMTSPDLADVDAEWSTCMTNAGQTGFAMQMDAQNSISEQVNALYENAGEVGLDEAAMAEIGEKEIDLALIDLDCREEVDYKAKQQDVQYKLEQQFVDDHKSELEALKADLEQGS